MGVIALFIVFIIVWFVATGKSLERFMDNGVNDPVAWALGAVSVLMLSWMLNAAAEHERKNPCVAYESRMTYNAATKMMAPMRVCVERGEWEDRP